VSAIGNPTQIMWMPIPVRTDAIDAWSLGAADSGTTIQAIKKYTATPYKIPETTACSIRKFTLRLST
jgi:hypothetical protein